MPQQAATTLRQRLAFGLVAAALAGAEHVHRQGQVLLAQVRAHRPAAIARCSYGSRIAIARVCAAAIVGCSRGIDRQ
ncbi:hypothetical protein [Xanthomonas sacchari]|uniref:hypothetical protein n=1 Tax=Xanthomonas sacchari TaxID=56458 RepID=UPI003D18DC11